MNRRALPTKLPVPTGAPWIPSPVDLATVPVPLLVIIVSVDGPYTERDRKLWTFLLQAMWDDLDKHAIHELRVQETLLCRPQRYWRSLQPSKSRCVRLSAVPGIAIC